MKKSIFVVLVLACAAVLWAGTVQTITLLDKTFHLYETKTFDAGSTLSFFKTDQTDHAWLSFGLFPKPKDPREVLEEAKEAFKICMEYEGEKCQLSYCSSDDIVVLDAAEFSFNLKRFTTKGMISVSLIKAELSPSEYQQALCQLDLI